MITFLSFGAVYAQDSGKTAEEKKPVMSDKMEGMDMHNMSGMKNDCMKENKKNVRRSNDEIM